MIPPVLHRDELERRFFASIEKVGDCWLWIGSGSDGYGTLYYRGHTYRATRVSWWLHNNWAATNGLLLLHSCDQRQCVNPAHLRLGTARENAQDRRERGTARGRGMLPLYIGARVTVTITKREIAFVREFGSKYGNSLETILRRGLQCLAEQEKSKEK